MEISTTMDHMSNPNVAAPSGNQDPAMSSQDEAEENMLRFSPTSPFVTMRHYISEFDPNEAVTNMSMNALKLLDSWKAYVNTFIELCDVQKVPVENRRKLLLVLAGSKLRLLLDQLEVNAESKSQTLEDTVRVITNHFESRKAVQMARYHFFYSPQNKQRPGESVNDWTSRLITMSEKCQFSKSVNEGMTVNDALTVVMYKQSVEDHNKRSEVQTKANNKNGPSDVRKCKGEVDEDEDHTLPVDVQWGDGDESEHHQNHVMKVDASDPSQIQQPQLVQLNSFIYATRAPTVVHQQQQQSQQQQQQQQQQQPQVLSIRLPTEPNFSVANNSVQQINDANLTHSDMDLLRRARGGPCICPNCTLFPKRRAGKHNCHIPGCGREYAKTSHLRAHLVSHCNVLPFACSWVGCNKRFYRTDQLTRHARIHTGEKKFTCGVCDHAFSRSDHLAKHVRRHTNVANGGTANNQNQSNPNQQPAKITIAHTSTMQAVAQGTNAVISNSIPQGPQNIVTSTSNNLAAAAAAAAAAHNQQHMLSMSSLPYMQMPPKNTPHIFYH